MANAAVAYASAVARSGPTMVTDSSPLAGAPVCGSTMCAPRSYSPDVATARSSTARTAASWSCSTGWRTPTRPRRAGGGRPRATTSPPALMQKRSAPAAVRSRAAPSIAQPLTRPDGSRRPAGRAGKKTRGLRSSARQRLSTSSTAGRQSASVISPRSSRLISLSSRKVLKVASTSRSQANAGSTSMPSPAARSMPIGMPMMWRTSVRCAFAGTPGVSASGRGTRSVQRLAARRPDHLAADVLRRLGGEEDVDRRELAGLAGAAERRVGAELRVLVGREAHDHERRPDRPGRDGVHADPALGDLLREALRERADRALRRAVVQELRAGLRGLDRGRVDDRRPLAHLGHRGLGEVEHRDDVRPEDEVDLLGRDVEERLVGHLEGGVVDEDVELAELVDRALHQSEAVVAVADVAGHRDAAPARLLDPPLRLGGVVMLLEVRAQHVGALARERDRDRPADARVRAGDQRDLVLQPAMADVRLLAVVGERLHAGLAPGRLLLLLGKRRLGLGMGGVLIGHAAGCPRKPLRRKRGVPSRP